MMRRSIRSTGSPVHRSSPLVHLVFTCPPVHPLCAARDTRSLRPATKGDSRGSDGESAGGDSRRDDHGAGAASVAGAALCEARAPLHVSPAAGNVDSVLADLNDHVNGGAALALLESADQQIALAQADASFDNSSKARRPERG